MVEVGRESHLILPTSPAPQLCSPACRPVTFTLPGPGDLARLVAAGRAGRVRRSPAPPDPPASRHPGVEYSVVTVAGVDWVCEQLSESQCKPLWPKVGIVHSF